MASRIIKGTIVTAASALALAAGNASAIEFTTGDTTVQIYGYAIAKASYDIDEDLGNPNYAQYSAVNTGDAEDDEITGHFDISANQSRFGIITSTDMSSSDLVTRIEGDFIAGQFRLRHAYGSWNNILGGQTWSTYSSFVGSTPTIDFNSVNGNAGYQSRTVQLRYTMGNFAVALEDPQTSILGAATTVDTAGFQQAFLDALAANDTPPSVDAFETLTTGGGKSSLPALAAHYEATAGALGFAVGGILRQIEVDNGDDSDTALGFGTFVAANFDMGIFSLQGALNYTDGAQSYLYLSGAPDAYLNADGDLETLTGIGGTIGASVEAGNGSFNLGYGFTDVDYEDAEDDGMPVANNDETRTSLFLNYLWSPVDNVTYGVELAHLTVEEVDGDDGDGNRLYFMTQYSF